MDKELFVRKYLERISYSGGRDPTLKNLTILHKEHVKAITFENTYILKNIPIKLTKEWLYEKVIVKKRGGFCYELNYLFYLLLVDLGYEVQFLGGSVYHPATGAPGLQAPTGPHSYLYILVSNAQIKDKIHTHEGFFLFFL